MVQILKNIDNSLDTSYLEDLNPAQRKAVEFDNGPLLVIAGAGSGKTKTLVYRVVRLVSTGIPPEKILLLTFTRKSAQEMLTRASKVLDQRCHDVAGGTFHAFATLILREFSQTLGFNSQFIILDRSDAEDILQLLRKNYKALLTEKRFPKKNTLLDIIGKCLNTQSSISDVLQTHYPQFLDYVEEITAISAAYKQKKKDMQVMDYDDLLIYLDDLLKQNDDVRRILQQRFKYIMVDEYQDTNRIQSSILFNLVDSQRNLMVVGDDSQSIYSFRGANFKNIMSFEEQYPGTTRIMLEQNYRSKSPILDLTNAVIAQAREKFTKNLFTEQGDGSKPFYIETDNEGQQSRFVCQKILELRESGISLSRIAILVRSGWHSNDLELALQSHDLPFVKFGGFKFIESSHVKDLVAFFRLTLNPADILSWHRVLLLLDGVGPKSVQVFLDTLAQNNFRVDASLLSPFRQKAYFQQLLPLIDLLITLHSLDPNPSSLLPRILTYYLPIFKQRYDNFKKREADLDSFEGICQRYKDLNTLLTDMSLDPPTSSQIGSEAAPIDQEFLTISTIHSAKGLEWHSVFLLSVLDGYLPSFQSMGDMSQLEEERRLLYVALTRAEENLYILKPNSSSASFRQQYQGMQFSQVSRFLSENDIIGNYAQRSYVESEDSGFKTRQISQQRNDDNVLFSSKKDREDTRKFYF
ncbi:MAG: UvrD-helicase domain-containing protein [bacterium]